MRVLKYIIVSVCLMTSAVSVRAQQEPQFTQYMFNGLAINPAYAGSREVLSMVALYRNQWVGLDGAPTSMLFSIHSPLFSKQFSGGLQVLNDQIGVNSQTNVTLNASYWIPVGNNNGRLSFGLRGGVTNFNSDKTGLNLFDPDEDNFASNISSVKPNVGGGLYYYSDRFYAGVSSLQLLENEFGVDGNSFGQLRHAFIYLGYVLDLTENWKFKPTALVKTVKGTQLNIDVTAHFLYNEKLWLGTTYRTSGSVDVLAHFMITKELGLGYSYGIPTTGIRSNTSGSHEVLLRYEPTFGATHNVKSPRYF